MKSPRGAKIGAAEKPAYRSSGAAAPRVHIVPVDLDELPEDLAAAFVEACKPYRHGPRMIADLERKKARTRKAKRRARLDLYHELKPRPKGVWDTDSGRMARALELATDWITGHEIRQITGWPNWALQPVLYRLWERGALLKRKNPSRAKEPRRAIGVEACSFQYRRASGVNNVPGDQDAGAEDEVQESGQ